MKLRVVELSDEQQRILKQLSAWGGVLDFGFFATCSGHDATEGDHREAVKLTMFRLRSELETTNDRKSVERGIDRSKFFTIRFEEASVSALVPKQISWQQFLGTRYDFGRQGLLVRGDQKYYNNLFFYKDEEQSQNIVQPTEFDEDDCSEGLAYAFSDPPYPLCSNLAEHSPRVSLREKGELFHDLLEKVICVSEDAAVYRWPTDWCNYFDAGNEWWGSFLWTLANQGSDRIVVIAASASD